MLIPEIILYNSINNIIKLVGDNYVAATDKTKTILYDFFGVGDDGQPLKLEKFDYYTNAVALFTRDISNPNQISVNIGYNLQRKDAPTIHIVLPAENKGRYNSLGEGFGEEPSVYNYDDQEVVHTYATSNISTYNLIITAGNSSMVLVIYYALKNMLTFLTGHFGVSGLKNLEVTGADLQLDPSIAPPDIFHRSLNLSFDYESKVKQRVAAKVVSSLTFNICATLGDEYDNYFK
jgi:hypothetical protein